MNDYINNLPKHIVQSNLWLDFKKEYGANITDVGGVLVSVSNLPFGFKIGYAPKVNPQKVNFEDLKSFSKKNNLIAIRFDTPFVVKGTKDFEVQDKLMREHCLKASDTAFTRYDILQDIAPSLDDILSKMKSKTRYNVRYATKNGVKVRFANSSEDFSTFYNLLKSTAQRQKYGIRDKKYYQLLWSRLKKSQKGEILIAEHENNILACWFVSVLDGIGYYMYGGSSLFKQNLQVSSLLAFEAIRFSKEQGASIFDFWGVDKNLDNKNSKFYGVTRFKLGFGGEVIEYMDSYDLVIDKLHYSPFISLYGVREKINDLRRSIF